MLKFSYKCHDIVALALKQDPVCLMEQVHKEIDGVRILRGIDLSIQKGEVTALLGPNGAGKTSTIRIIVGLLKPTSGKVEVFGLRVPENQEIIRSKIGLLPQDNAGYKGLTARQNIEFMIELSGKKISDYRGRINSLLDRLDLSEVADKKWGVLSGGEQRAIGFIRAVLVGEEFLILDEPTTGLDLARAAIIRKLIQEQVNSGKTVLMSSHILTDLEELAKNIVIIKKGKIIKSGSREEIQNHFAKGLTLEDAIVAAFRSKEQ
ncbi:MAG: ABC transporter ATP-binding protein [Candidatus Heimdallarchaeota archaeon]|nr:ABC transporter ATP-binding protein [Candidatus Heimdallarchaeota archaeon]